MSLVWTRDEELTWAYFRPAGVIDVRAAARCERHDHGVGVSQLQLRAVRHSIAVRVANQRIEFHGAKSPLRQGSYRGLAATANHFARESHMDDWRRRSASIRWRSGTKHLRDERLAGVLDAAASKFGWDSRKRATGRGHGLACGTEKGGYVATCAEVAVDGRRRSRDPRVALAFECGAIVNPDGLKNQVEGAVVQGLGGALFEAIAFEDGQIVERALRRLPCATASSTCPPSRPSCVDRQDLPSAGAGETPIVGIAPAIANAIFDATGVRLRALPLVPEGLPAASSSESAGTGTTPPAAPRRSP